LLPRKSDVVVIGGGLIGTSITYHLSKLGAKVILLEKEGIASGSSSGCEGGIFLQTKKPSLYLKLALRSAKRFDILEEELDFKLEYVKRGGMLIIRNEEELKVMKSRLEKQREIGLEVSLLDKKQAKEMEPELSDKILGATFSAMDGRINPMYLCHAFTKAAQRLGASIFTHTKVIAIKKNKKRIVAVKTVNGDILTETVVNTAGVYAPEIGKMVNLNIPIKPRRGQLLVTEIVPQLVYSQVTEAKYIALKYNPKIAEEEDGAGAGAGTIHPIQEGNILIGSTREFVGYDTRNTFKELNMLARNAINLIPRLKDVKIIRTYAGLRPYTADGFPILGKVKEVEGFIMAAGHEGDGIALSPITGELIAQLIVDGDTTFPLEEFRLERFMNNN
jgi:sarcosine oxidase subunit beta